jgi:hypothetical protein
MGTGFLGALWAILKVKDEMTPAIKQAEQAVRAASGNIGKSFDTLAGHRARLNSLFESFSGDKVIRDAAEYAQAVRGVGGASALTAAEQARVNAVVTEAIAKYRLLGEKAPADLHALASATQKLEPPLSLADKAAGLLKSTFGQFTLANLAASAISSLTSSLMDFAAQGVKLPAIQQSFDRLTSGLKQNGAEMLANMRAATQGMVSNLDLMQSANKAMLLGLPVTAQSMGELAKAATTLGRAMGQDATKSLDDLITALGRSSPMILDNLGLSVKVGEANETYAAKLGKAVEALSDAEKKTAFYAAAMEAARRKTAELGEHTRTLTEIAQSAWTKIGNAVTSRVAEINTLFQRMNDDLDNYGLRAVKAAAVKPPAIFTPEGVRQIRLTDEEMERVNKTLDEQRQVLDKASEKARQHAEAFRAAVDQMKGTTAINAAADALKRVSAAMHEGVPLAKMTREQQDAVNKTMLDAMAVYKALGKQVPADIHAVYFATLDLSEIAIRKSIPLVQGLGDALKDLGEQATVSTGDLDLINQTTKGWPTAIENVRKYLPIVGKAIDVSKTWADTIKDNVFTSLQQVPQMVVGAFTGGGGLGGAMQGLGSMLGGTLGKSIGAGFKALGKFGGPIGEAIGSLAGPLIGKLVDMFKGAGRLAVEEFAKSMGGFDTLHVQLNALGDAGERMWIKLTQGVKKGDKKGAQAVIDEIKKALGANQELMDAIAAAGFKSTDELQKTADTARRVYEYMRDSGKFSADAVAEAWEKSQEAQRAALIATGDVNAITNQQALDAIKKMDDELHGLFESIKDEAPEEVMGDVERATRARIAAIEAERNAAQDAINATTGTAAAAADEAGRIIDEALSRREFHVRVKVDLDGLPTGAEEPEPANSGYAFGTPRLDYRDFGRVTPTNLHGREAVVPESGVGEFAGQVAAALSGQISGGGGGDIVIHHQTVLDGRVIDERVERVGQRNLDSGRWRVGTRNVKSRVS